MRIASLTHSALGYKRTAHWAASHRDLHGFEALQRERFSCKTKKKPRQGWRLPWFFDAVLRENIRFGAYKSLWEAALTYHL